MIKCFEPNLTDEDIQSVLKTLKSKTLSFGPNVSAFESRYAKFSKKKHNIGFNSASSAFYLFFQYLYETHGQCTIYTTSLGFVSPIYAATKNGHQVVFVDVDENLLMSVDDLSSRFTPRSSYKSVVMPVLYGGVSKVPGLEQFCQDNDCILAIDSAHCISPGMDHDYAFYSFHPVKPLCMSNGGLLSTNISKVAEYMYCGRNFGRQTVGDSYDIIQPGFNFYMNNLNASLGLSQMDKCLENVKKRKMNFDFLKKSLPSKLGYLTYHDENSSYYLSTLVLTEHFSSDIMREELSKNGVESSFHYPFLHKTSLYKQELQLPNLESLQDKIINLPIHQELTQSDLERVVYECVRYSRSRCES